MDLVFITKIKLVFPYAIFLCLKCDNNEYNDDVTTQVKDGTQL